MHKFSFKNPFNQTFKSWQDSAKNNTTERTAKKANRLFADKTHADEYRAVFLLSTGLKWCAACISFLSGCFAAYYLFSFLFGAVLALCVGVLSCLLLELLKNSLWSTTAKQFLKYRSFVVGGVLSLFCLHLVSFGASVFGARCAADYIDFPSGSGSAADGAKLLTDVAQPYNTQITAIDKQTAILLSEKPNSKTGKYSSTTKGIIKELNKQKDSLQTAKNRAIEHTKKQNDKITQEREKTLLHAELQAKNKREFYASAAAVTAAVFELLFILCQLFILKYLFRAYIDSHSHTAQHKKTTITANVTGDVTEPKQRTIGFKSVKVGVGGVAECRCCSSEFVKNAHNQKYCSDVCRIDYWEQKNGKKLVTGK